MTRVTISHPTPTGEVSKYLILDIPGYYLLLTLPGSQVARGVDILLIIIQAYLDTISH